MKSNEKTFRDENKGGEGSAVREQNVQTGLSS